MVEKTLTFALFDSNDGSPGGLVPEILTALAGIQDAVRLMVQHLGDRDRGPGQPARWIRDQSTLRLVEMRPGSLIADLIVEAPPDGQHYLDNFGDRAIEALQAWNGSGSSDLPSDVTDTLHGTAAKLPEGVQLWFGNKENPRRVQVQRKPVAVRTASGVTEALLHGWLYEVNWDKGTAQLYDYSGEFVQLRFAGDFHEDMLRLATRFVEVGGKGRFNDNDQWTSVEVQHLKAARTLAEPFDVDTFLNDPNPKIFDPEAVVTASEPFDVDEFIRGIRDGRDVQREDPAE